MSVSPEPIAPPVTAIVPPAQSAASCAYTGGSILPGPDADVKKKGEELLEEYDVGYNQTIRFPQDGRYYESYGAYALTTMEEVRTRYPKLLLPEQIGAYRFADLTLYTTRTDNVFPDTLPRPKESIEVLTSEEAPSQYYVCYKNDSVQFRVTLWPMSLPEVSDMFADTVESLVPWERHTDVYLETSFDDPQVFSYLMIAPEYGGEYAFFVHKIALTQDCLESRTQDLTEEEAESIYMALREGFPAKETP